MMRKILLLLTGLCAFWIINAQSRLNVKALRNLRPQRCVSTKVNKAITSNTKNAAYLQDFEGDFPGDMIILDLDGLTPNGEAGAPGEWGIVARFDDETNHAAAVTSYYDDGDKTSNDWMITSKITVPASGEINLIWEASSWSSVYPETYEVLISETQPDAANFDNTKFTKVAEITETVGYTYNALDLSNYYGKDIWVAYRNISNWMWSIGIDNIQVNDFTGLDLAFTSVSYQKKVALEQGQTITGNVTSMRSTKVTSFDVNWKVGDGATNTYSVSEVEIDMMANHKFEHDIQYTPSAIGTETITIWISNVNGTSNDAIADNNEMSMDVEVIEGSYYQDFESSFPGVYTYDIDEQPIGDYPPASWSFTSILGTILAYSPAVDGTDDWIVFPKISIDEGEFLSWKHSAHSDSNPQKYEIYVADTFDPENFNASTFTLIETIDGVDNTSLESFAIPLDKYAGESKYFAFRNVTDIAGGYTFIDDIHVFAPTTDSDAELVKIIGLQEYYSLNDEINVKGIFKNLSASDVTSYEISYQYGDAAVVSQIFDASTITFLQSEEFVFDQKIAADAHGIFTFKVWISKVNSAVDSNTDNNELTLDIEIISDPQEKIVLIEEFTGAWCGACPRGGLILNNLIEKYNGKVIGIAHHINDSMAISDADQILNAYATALPTAMINRTFWPQLGTHAINEDLWESKVQELLEKPTTIGIDLTNDYNEETRELTAELTINFTRSESGNYATHLFIIEDNLSGEGTGWDQTNFFNNDPSSPFYQQGSYIEGFIHNHVVRNILSYKWGDSEVIPTENIYGEYSKTYTFTLPDEYKVNDITIVGFISKYDNVNKKNRTILNAVEGHLEHTKTNSVEDYQKKLEFSIYPNPTKGLINITNLNKANVYVYSVIGTLVKTENNLNGTATIDLSQLEKGIYIVKVTEGNSTGIRKILLEN